MQEKENDKDMKVWDTQKNLSDLDIVFSDIVSEQEEEHEIIETNDNFLSEEPLNQNSIPDYLRELLFYHATKGSRARDLFPAGFQFKPSEQLSDDEISLKLCSIRFILNSNGIYIDLRPELPERVIYDFIIDKVLDEPVLFIDPGSNRMHVMDGCDGSCENCFQSNYCDICNKIE